MRRPPCLLAALLVLGSFASVSPQEASADAKRPWTLLLYGAVDNSADDPFVAFTDQVRRAIDDDPGIELVVLIDRSKKHAKRATFLGDDFDSTRLYRVKKDSVERLSGGTHFPEITKDSDVNLNSADAATLQRFIAWGKATYPAQRYGLLIYSHADGQSMCPDDRLGASMGIAEVTDRIGADERVDFLALELCNMGGAEIAYQWRPGNGRFEADVLLAIPNAGPPLDWHRAFSRIRSPGHASKTGPAVDPAKMTAVDFGKLVIEEGHRGRQASEKPGGRGSRESAGCYDLRKAGAVKEAVDALAVALAKTDSKGALLGAAQRQFGRPAHELFRGRFLRGPVRPLPARGRVRPLRRTGSLGGHGSHEKRGGLHDRFVRHERIQAVRGGQERRVHCAAFRQARLLEAIPLVYPATGRPPELRQLVLSPGRRDAREWRHRELV